MTYPRSREGAAPVTVRLEDLALSDRESIFHAPRAGDVALLGVLVAVLLGNGVWIWRQLGANSQAGRAVFFGLLLLCFYWCAVIYTLKLSLSVRISPRSISVARGPWQVEIRWSELSRLMERMQTLDGRRYRWVIAVARDGRRISIREDAIGDYARFRREAYERYRLWRDHGGTWGATGSGPFVAREIVRDEAQWWAVAAVMVALPGIYFALLLPETDPLGYLLLAGAVACMVMLARAFLLRQSYTIERQYIEARSAVSRTRLAWSEVSKVERLRHPVSGIILSGVALGRLALRLASRADAGIRTFAWSPRVPEYLILRGGGRHARIKLHRLMQPDELLAWIEFYDQVRRSASASRSRPMSGPLAGPAAGRASGGPASGPIPSSPSAPLSASTSTSTSAPLSGPISSPNLTPDMSGASGPIDPWGAGRQGEPAAAQPSQPLGPRTLKTPFVGRTPTTPHLPDLPDGAASWQAHATHEPHSAQTPDLPTVRTPAASRDDAWLRETSAQPSIESDQPDAPYAPYAPPAAGAATPAWDEWQEPAAQQRDGHDHQGQYGQRDQYGQRADLRERWQVEPAAPMPAPQTPAAQHDPPADSAWMPGERWPDDPWANSEAPVERDQADEVETPTPDVESPQQAPWREEGWRPPLLPRFGPTADERAAQRDEPPGER
ncbi:MAG TPA: hypothetical protein VE338_05080 [Ktedonobacterales bacterium]|nr:hypothetical protein [Ktedonobacterales bacterium]